MNDDLYEVLGVSEDASPEDIKAAYRRAVKEHHPDRGGDAERFVEISQAYTVLSDPMQRADYDNTGMVEKINVLQDQEAVVGVMAQVLGDIIEASIQAGRPISSINIVERMAAILNEAIGGLDKKMVDVGLQLSSYSDLRKKIRRRGEGKNEFARIIDQKTAGLRATYKQMQKEMRWARRAVEELGRYKSEVEVFRTVQASMYPASGSPQSVFFGFLGGAST